MDAACRAGIGSLSAAVTVSLCNSRAEDWRMSIAANGSICAPGKKMHGEPDACQVRHGTCSYPCDGFDVEAIIQPCRKHKLPEITMQWTKPEYTDLRFGFEITMYIANR